MAITRMGRPENTGAIDLALEQSVGVTWNRVAKIADTQSRMEIQTTAATVMVRGTEFKLSVSPDNTAEVITSVGTVEFQAAGVSVAVDAGYLSVAQPGAPPTPPTPAPPPTRALTISLAGTASVFVTDERGRSLGLFPETGSYINQIPDAWYSGSRSDPQVLRLADPTARYHLVISPIAQHQQASTGAWVAGWYSAEPSTLASPSYYPGRVFAAAASNRFRLDLDLMQSGGDSQDSLEDELEDDGSSYSMDLEVGENGLRRGNLTRRGRSDLQLPRQVISRMEMTSGVVPTAIPTRPPTATPTRQPSPQPTSAATAAPTPRPSPAPTQAPLPTPLPVSAPQATPIPNAVATPVPSPVPPTAVPTTTTRPTLVPTAIPPTVAPTEVPPTEAPLVDVPAPATATSAPAPAEPTMTPLPPQPTATRAPTRPPLATATPLPPPSWRLLPQ